MMLAVSDKIMCHIRRETLAEGFDRIGWEVRNCIFDRFDPIADIIYDVDWIIRIEARETTK